LYVIEEIVTTTIEPGQRADLADSLARAFRTSSAERVARLQVAFGQLLRLAVCGWKNACWRPKRAMIARKPTLMKASLVSQARRRAGRSRRAGDDHPGLTR
jgi:hypothetical protein